MTEWPFGNLQPFSYGLIMADPAWTFETYSERGQTKSPANHYATMSLAEIEALPVSQLARGDALLWLWATNPMLPQAFKVMAAWGFRFVTAGTWVKTTKTGKLAFGTGYVLRSASEPFLIGAVGNPESARNVRSVIMAPVREHSRKPEAAYRAAEALCPQAIHRADLFCRETRAGWSGWGRESTKFDQTNRGEHEPTITGLVG